MSETIIVDESTGGDVTVVEETTTLVLGPAGTVVEVVEEPIQVTVLEPAIVKLVPPAGPGPPGAPGPGFGATQTITAADSPFQVPAQSLLLLVDTTDGDVDIHLPDLNGEVVVIQVKKLVEANQVIVSSPSGDLIDGDASQVIVFEGTSVSLRFDQASGWWLT